MYKYALITKPLTKYLAGENGRVSQNQSKNDGIELDEEALNAISKLKNELIQQVELSQPAHYVYFKNT